VFQAPAKPWHAACAIPIISTLARHGGWPDESPGQNGNRNHDCYDQRFTGLFLDELELRGSPRYPDGPWFTALARADYEFKCLGPFKPVIWAYQSPETSGVHEYNHDEDLSRSVNLACTRWLAQHEHRAGERAVYGPVWTPSPCGT
jgi:hypothetical protein